jgi:putative transposase
MTPIICARRPPKPEPRSVIPPKRNRNGQCDYDVDFTSSATSSSTSSQAQTVSPGCDARSYELLVNFGGFVKLAAIAIWLK